jgi:hypothetical protein
VIKIEEEVKGNVERLLSMVCNDLTDSDAYEFVLSSLTRMAMVGTAPPSCAPREGQAGRKVASKDNFRDFSEEKERWIGR